MSRSTVSRVINASLHVAPEARDAVNRAVVELGYIPNRSARSLATRRNDSIALIMPATQTGQFPPPYFASVVQGVVDAGSAAGHAIRIVSSNADSPSSRGTLYGDGFSGAVVISCESTDAYYASLDSTSPIVFVGRPAVVGAFYVDPEHKRGAADAAVHLVSRGRRRVAMLAGPPSIPGAVQRLAGWRAVLGAHGINIDLVEHGDFTAKSGAEAMRALIDADPHLDAVLIANDQMAAGAYSVILASGRRIPDDVAVVGFDNDDYFGSTATPALTTVDQRSAQLGATALRVLTDRLAGRPAPRATHLRTQLLVRDST